MTAAYNVCLRTGCFPVSWKIAKILPIVKPGREKAQTHQSTAQSVY